MTRIARGIGENINVGHRFIVRVATDTGAHHKLMVNSINSRKRFGVMALLTNRHNRHMGRRERLIGELAQMTRRTIGADQLVIDFSDRRPEAGEVATATILAQNGHMGVRLTGRNHIVVAADTGATHCVVIYPHHRCKLGGVVAGLTLIIGGYVIGWLAESIEVVVARHTLPTHLLMTEAHRLPADIRVAIRALIVHEDMVSRLTGRGDVVVAVFTAAENFMVIDDRNRLPSYCAVAAFAALAGNDVVDRPRRGIEATVETVAIRTLFRCAGKLAADVAALAGNKIMPATEFKPCPGVIEHFLLGEGNTGISHQYG